MPPVQLRFAALAWFSLTGLAGAQGEGDMPLRATQSLGQIYESSRQDVTVPVASSDYVNGETDVSVSVPVENLPTPMRCMTAWSYLAGQVIRNPDAMTSEHPDFTEATASAHWQHWLRLDFDDHQGGPSPDFHQRRAAAERNFSLALAEQEETYAYRTLGTCYVPPLDRLIADPTQLLRNFMVEHQGLPDTFSVPVLQRQLRAFPIVESIDVATTTSCDSVAEELQISARDRVILECFERGGILASQPRTEIETIDTLCRATGTVQCENIP